MSSSAGAGEGFDDLATCLPVSRQLRRLPRLSAPVSALPTRAPTSMFLHHHPCPQVDIPGIYDPGAINPNISVSVPQVGCDDPSWPRRAWAVRDWPHKHQGDDKRSSNSEVELRVRYKSLRVRLGYKAPLFEHSQRRDLGNGAWIEARLRMDPANPRPSTYERCSTNC